MGGSPDIGSGGPKDDSITASDWMKGNEHNVVLLRIGTWKAAMAAHPRTQIQFHPKAGLPCGTLFSEARSMPALLGHPAPPCSTRHQDLHRPLPVVHGQRVKASVTMRDGGAKGEGVRAAGDGQLVAADGCARTCSSISYVSKAPAAAPAAIPPPPPANRPVSAAASAISAASRAGITTGPRPPAPTGSHMDCTPSAAASQSHNTEGGRAQRGAPSG